MGASAGTVPNVRRQDTLQEEAAAASSNADRCEGLANDLRSLVITYLGSEPTAEASGPSGEKDLEPCLYGSLHSSNNRTRKAMDGINASMDRLRASYAGS